VDVTSLGDVLFGPLVLLVLVRPRFSTFLLYLVSGVLVGCIFVGFAVLAGSIAFFVGNSDSLAAQIHESLIHFSTYPSVIFDGGIKIVLFTLIPAGFINSVPIRVMRDFDPHFFALLVGVAAFFLWVANHVFKLGLRRYESGNLMQVRM
jgi:ABC-2 type transport system permease protein